MRSNYGQTWWGAQWLNALAQIDCDNRLPRGRTYANKGAVTQLVMQHGQIRAKVAGSRPRPYNVEIEVPTILPMQVNALLDALAANPVTIAKMLNRELDPSVLAVANRLKIPVFPARWQDLSMHCSCPDYAVPCKHLAAVIYLVSREIDGNPFIVFSLRGVDLADALKQRGIAIEREAEATLPTVDDLLAPRMPQANALPGQTTSPTLPAIAEPASWTALDYAILPDLRAALVGVLPPQPPFFQHGDFRLVYEKLLKRVATCARNALGESAAGGLNPPAIAATDKPRIALDVAYRPVVEGIAGVDSWSALLIALRTLSEADLPDLQPEVTALHQVRMASLHLLAQGAVLPQIFDAGKSGIAVRWLPAMLDATVREMVCKLAGLLPSELLVARSARKDTVITGEAQALVLCSLFLNDFIAQWSNVVAEKPTGNKILHLFFGQIRTRFDDAGEGALRAGIQVWLSRFHLQQQQYMPVLVLDENGTGFGLSLAVEKRDALLEKPTQLSDVLSAPAWQASRYGVLQTVSLLSEFFPALNGYVSAGATTSIALTAQALPAFLFDTLPLIRLLGIRALLPKALDRILRPRLSMKVSGKRTTPSGFLNTDDLLNFDWAIALGSAQLTLAEFEKLVKTANGIVRFKGEYVYLDPTQIEQLRAYLQKPQQPTGPELLRIALAEEYAGAPVVLDARARSIIAALTAVGVVQQPAALNATLRPYQERGFAWLYRNIRSGFGSVIADDMGLGKTLQVIAMLLKLKEEGDLAQARALVIVPTSLLTNWSREIARFAPTLSTGIFHGTMRALDPTRPDVLLTTYGLVRSELARLKKLPWRVVIIDEAQNIKNPATAQTKAVKSIPAPAFIAMSGTPVENRLSEYWSIMDFANRGFLGTLTSFTKEFAVPIQTDHDQAVALRFKQVTSPFLLRRLKSDKSIISDLPDKIEQDQYCELSPTQTALYESVVREALRVINGESDAFKRQGMVLQMIMALKQICNHPAQYLKMGPSEAILSGKAGRLLDLLEAIHASHEKVLVFTQFREMGTLLAGWIKEKSGRAPQFLHGGVARKKRDEMVERFQNDRTERVFILSLKAGGTGLNLTAAANVIHYDLWWNPAVEAQATDRAYRIGQLQNVQVHRLITRATFEERINEMIQSKRNLADLVVGAGENWIGNLSDVELKDVFSLR